MFQLPIIINESETLFMQSLCFNKPKLKDMPKFSEVKLKNDKEVIGLFDSWQSSYSHVTQSDIQARLFWLMQVEKFSIGILFGV